MNLKEKKKKTSRRLIRQCNAVDWSIKKIEWYLRECADSQAIKTCPAIYVLKF